MSGFEPRIYLAGPDDLAAVTVCLTALARDLGDPFRATDDSLSAALFAPDGFALALLARCDGRASGVALAAPLFSTSGGGSLLYVSDLWVDPAIRGRGLGRRLLAAAHDTGRARWRTGALKLTVYSDNAPALAFYRRMGFVLQEKDRSAILSAERASSFAKEAV